VAHFPANGCHIPSTDDDIQQVKEVAQCLHAAQQHCEDNRLKRPRLREAGISIGL
jgi:hypothetical protein